MAAEVEVRRWRCGGGGVEVEVWRWTDDPGATVHLVGDSRR